VSVVGNESGPQVETLTNTGGSELVINSVAISGTDATDFSQTSTCGPSLGAGANCTLNVTFKPSALGQRSAAITVTDDSAGSPQVLALNGMGGDSGPNATLSSPSLNLGNQVIGTTGPAQPIMLSNYGTATLGIASIAASAGFAETNTCSSTLASGAFCTINVTFTPSATGSLNGTLSLTDNAPGSPHSVSLSGTGVTSNETLTGYCFHFIAGTPDCTYTQDLAQCPARQPAIDPTWTAGCAFPRGEIRVDAARHCSAQRGDGNCAIN